MSESAAGVDIVVEKKAASRGRRSRKWSRLKFWGGALFVLFVFLFLTGGGAFLFFTKDLPRLKTITNYQPWLSSKVFARDGSLLGEYFEQRRDLTPSTQFPKYLVPAFVATEDAYFYHHKGLNYKGIARAMLKNVAALDIKEGGSSITQQTAKMLLLSPERKFSRKFKEALLAMRIEKYLSKDDIMYIYLNEIYFGHGFYGVGAAARGFFNKEVKNLDLAECALLAGLTRAPSNYSPIRFPTRSRERRDYVLLRMKEEKYITPEQYQAALRTPLKLDCREARSYAPYFLEYIRQKLEAAYGRDKLYHAGLKIYTTLDAKMQQAAEEAVRRGVAELDRREGYRGPLKNLAASKWEEFLNTEKKNLKSDPVTGGIYTALVTAVNDVEKKAEIRIGPWAGTIRMENIGWNRRIQAKASAVAITRMSVALSVGDVVMVQALAPPPTDKKSKSVKADTQKYYSLYQEPQVQASLLCLDNRTGEIRAMVGGTNFYRSQFNRSIQSVRQVGSSIKPFIYAAAIDSGKFTAASIIIDAPVVYEGRMSSGEEGTAWKPSNYGGDFYGPTPLREALVHSRNLVTIKVLESLGMDYSLNYLRRFRLNGALPRDLTLALGTPSLSLIDMVKAYSVFPAQGKEAQPFAILRVQDFFGNVLMSNNPQVTEVIASDTAYITTSLMRDVVRRGTGAIVGRLGRECAGKTGTTNDLKDAWFIGFTPTYTAGVWVGFDDNRPLGRNETGGKSAAPIWLYFMQQALEGRPHEYFQIPDGLVFAKINRATGKLAGADDPDAFEEVFKVGTAPTEVSPANIPVNPDEFYRYDLEGTSLKTVKDPSPPVTNKDEKPKENNEPSPFLGIF